MICAIYNAWRIIYHSQFSNSDIAATDISNQNVIDRKENLNDQKRLIPGKHFWFVKRELRKLTAMVLSLNIKHLHSHRINPKKINSAAKGILTYMKQEFLVLSDPSEKNFSFAYDKASSFLSIR